MLDLTPYKPRLIELCKAFSVERLDLVGSAVREDFDAEASDIDVLIQFAGKENLFHRYFDLKFKLEELFGKKVATSAIRPSAFLPLWPWYTPVHRERPNGKSQTRFTSPWPKINCIPP